MTISISPSDVDDDLTPDQEEYLAGLRAAQAPELAERYGLRCPPRYSTPRRWDRPTYGPKVARVAAKLGLPLMPWQRYVLDLALEVDPATGRLAYREVIVTVPRQSGKTTLILAMLVWRCMAWQRQRVVYAAQSRNSAREKWETEHVEILESSPYVGRFLVRKANGSEAIIWRSTRSRHGITSTTETAGHGSTLDVGVIDEAFAQVDARLEQAFSPAMITRPEPQQWVVSTAGTERSAFFNGKRFRARLGLLTGGGSGSVAYVDWCALPHQDRADPATWRDCMPALGYTIDEAAIRAELEKMDGPEFDRAYLNVTRRWTPPPDPNVPTAEWPGLADPTSQAPDDITLAVDVSPARSSAAIGVAGRRPDGRWHVEIIDHRPGTGWVVERLVELRDRWRPVAVGLDPAGAAGSLLVPLEQAGMTLPVDPDRPQRGDLMILGAREAAQAAGAFADDCRADHDKIRHRDQPSLNAAVAGARTRPLGEAWAWARRTATADICPLVAVTIARRVHEVRAPAVLDNRPPTVW